MDDEFYVPVTGPFEEQHRALAALAEAADNVRPECVVEVGHVSVGRTAKWRDARTGMTVCDRHRDQYDERPDLGPFEWVPIERAEGRPT